jgi:hypothetical protein
MAILIQKFLQALPVVAGVRVRHLHLAGVHPHQVLIVLQARALAVLLPALAGHLLRHLVPRLHVGVVLVLLVVVLEAVLQADPLPVPDQAPVHLVKVLPALRAGAPHLQAVFHPRVPVLDRLLVLRVIVLPAQVVLPIPAVLHPAKAVVLVHQKVLLRAVVNHLHLRVLLPADHLLQVVAVFLVFLAVVHPFLPVVSVLHRSVFRY